MIEQLFGSKTRVKLLQLFYGNPNRSFYVREITRKIDEQINSVRRELGNLLSIGIIVSEETNNKLYYEVNQKYEYYEPLGQIFGGAAKTKKTNGANHGKAADVVIPVVPDSTGKFSDNADIKALGNIEIAIYTGQFSRDDRSGVDVFIVGDINQTKLSKFMAELEAKEGKELRYTSMGYSDFQYRKQINDRFVSLILSSKKQVLIDKHNSLKN